MIIKLSVKLTIVLTEYLILWLLVNLTGNHLLMWVVLGLFCLLNYKLEPALDKLIERLS